LYRAERKITADAPVVLSSGQFDIFGLTKPCAAENVSGRSPAFLTAQQAK
jgi:hypothetical protein